MKIAINGFGRIGRNVFRQFLKKSHPGLQIVAINDLTSAKTLAHLLKYDSVHGKIEQELTHTEDSITVGGHCVKVFAERD
ncbi:MAG: type I glyceraldehyde-3-phosphate dehydrogenase, partial [Bdellovibrionales bacterium]|nr:type I glyceraldehyde-3-phosphate dehydrogenase [Bdellovibrionales bacterium]